ncbi:MAG: thioredoxin [Thermoplasmata archaeon]
MHNNYKTEVEKMNKEWPGKPVEVTDEDIDDFIEKYPVSMIDCWAVWCGPCRMMEPVLNELAEEMKGEVVIGKLNVDKNRVKSSEFGVSSIPTLLIFKDGELKDKAVGAMPKDNLKQILEKYV